MKTMAQNVMTYNAEGRRTSLENLAGQVTTTAWDCCHLYPLGNATVYEYDLRGRKTYEGGATYPVRYTYDVFGNKVSMTTYRSESVGRGDPTAPQGDVTTWLYDEASGCITNKVYADGKGPAYSYTHDGKLSRRIWARGIMTDYSYDGWGNLTNTVYSDGTPSVTLAYDAMGRQTNAVDAAGIAVFTYDSFGSQTGETITGLYSKNIVRHYDSFGRADGYTSEGIRRTRISYESATGRISGLKSGGVWFDNHYLAGTDLRDRIKYGNSGYAYYTYETNRNILAQVKNVLGGNTISQYDYVCDAIGSRVKISRSGTMMSESRNDAYGYNERNELISAGRAELVSAAPEYAYQYDDIGNRITSSELDAGGPTFVSASYAANNLNQYTLISSSALSAPPREPFIPQYDDDGNQTLVQTSTGIWSVTYNGENRPEYWSNGTTNITMSFDRMGRRVEYLETVNADDVTITNTQHRFVYDGYLCIQRLNAAANNDIDLIFAWDPAEPVATRPLMIEKPGKCMLHVTHDGNKNVSDLVFFKNGSGVAAHYEYAPFGALTASTRNSTSTAYDFRTYNPFRFSSEYADDTLGLVYYNYRHYEPVTGRWLSRDRKFASNCYPYILSPLSMIDCLGDEPVNAWGWMWYDFFVWYLTGNGGAVDLSNWFQLGDFKARIADSIKSLKSTMAHPQYSCNSAAPIDDTYKGSVSGGFAVSDRAAFWYDAIGDSARVLNQGGLTITYTCSVHIDCECCKHTGGFYRTGGSVSCKYTYALKDRFANPTDRGGDIYADNYERRRECIKRCRKNSTLWERIRSDWNKTNYTRCLEECDRLFPETEILGGKPYDITATWEENSVTDLSPQSCP